LGRQKFFPEHRSPTSFGSRQVTPTADDRRRSWADVGIFHPERLPWGPGSFESCPYRSAQGTDSAFAPEGIHRPGL